MEFREDISSFSRVIRFILPSIVVFALAQTTIFAQAGQAEIVGEIIDANGASVPNVRVLLAEKQTNRTVETTSDANGNFIFTNQSPGFYSLKFEASGFTPIIREGITLTTGERIRIDTRLKIITLGEIVTINSDAPLLRSETSNLGQVIDNRKIVDLPINGRNFYRLSACRPESPSSRARPKVRVCRALTEVARAQTNIFSTAFPFFSPNRDKWRFSR